MDLNSLKDQVSSLTLYDLKAGVRKVQNAVMNYTEMEAKVREATNNEPWGASSTLMQEIANGTFNYQQLNEIMPMMYKRFTEKAAEEWRQIYKSLQLLEFLIKNGSERVIDDARSHISLLKTLRQFHFIDQNGKDQGINVRNRAKELAELLSDVDRIRAERKKARGNRNKFGGLEGGIGTGGFSSRGSRFGGLGSDDASFGGYSGGVYGDGGGFGESHSGFSDAQSRRDRFDEYDEYDEGEVAAPPRRREQMEPASSQVRREVKKADPPKPKEPAVDLLSFDDEPAPSASSNAKQAATIAADPGADDDDFDDFQSAATAQPASQPSVPAVAPLPSTSTITSSTQFAAPQPQHGSRSTSLNDLFSSVASPPASTVASPPGSTSADPVSALSTLQSQYRPSGYQAAGPNYFTSVPSASSASTTNAASSSTPSSNKPGPSAANATGGDVFASLLGTAAPKKTSTPTQKLTMADMARQKASAGIWGTAPAASAPASSTLVAPAPTNQAQPGSALNDLLG